MLTRGVNDRDLARESRTHQNLRSVAPIVYHRVYHRCSSVTIPSTTVSSTSRALNHRINQCTQITLYAPKKLYQITPYNMADRGNRT
jgi:hypothetical protein